MTKALVLGTYTLVETTFIYALNDPETGECRYVGKANDTEIALRRHMRDGRKKNFHKANWIKSLIARGLAPVLEILDEVPEVEWELWERAWIKASREIGMNLTNFTPGGEGGATTLGKKQSPEHVAKRMAAHIGKKRSAKTCAKMSADRRGKKQTPGQIKNALIGRRWKKQKRNTSGVVGVWWDKSRENWRCYLAVNKKTISLGRYKDKADAIFVRRLAEDKYFS